MAELELTSLETLKKMAKGETVELPPFDDGTPFVARLRKPSLLSLVSNGKIPNALLTSVSELFKKDSAKKSIVTDPENMDNISDTMKLMHIVAESALIEPSLKDIEQLGITLNDMQLTAIFNYTQTGVAKLQQFRKEKGNKQLDNDGAEVQHPAKRNTRP